MNGSSARDLRDPDGLRQEVPCAILRGTSRGLEMVIDARAAHEAIVVALEKRLAEAPGFFQGSDVRVTVDNGPLAVGTLTRLDDLAQRFELRIVEVAARLRAPLEQATPPDVAVSSSTPPRSTEAVSSFSVETRVEPADRTGGLREPAVDPERVASEASAVVAPIFSTASSLGARVVEGPIRSGAILDHVGHLIVFGDVNPGAEVRATGNIVVLGCLRGTAHAGIGRDTGFILALQLEPQQLRIGRKVARADANTRASNAEIAYATGESIVVERYSGRLPRNLSASI